MSRVLLEVIIQTVADAREAARGGADRLELVRDIRVGGLTPPLDLVRAVAAETRLPLRVMLREHDGFDLKPPELAVLRRTARELAGLRIDGIVIGFAREGDLALDDLRRVLEDTPDMKVTFHRAFDALRDPLAAIDAIPGLAQVDRILTSGGDGPASARCDRLRTYAARAAGLVEIMAGGGVDEEMLSLIAETGCVSEVHVGRLAREGGQEAPVSAERVAVVRRRLMSARS